MIKCCLAAGLSWDYYGSVISPILWDTLLSSSTLPEVHHIASDTDRLKRLQSGHLQTEHFHCCRNWNRWLWFMAYYSLSKPLHFKRVWGFIKQIHIVSLHKDDPALYIWSAPSTQVQLYKTVALLVAFSRYCLLERFYRFHQRQVNVRWWCLTSVIAEGRLVLCRSIDPKPNRTWSLETSYSQCRIGLQMIDIFWQAPKILGILGCFGLSHIQVYEMFYLLTPVFSITCWWVAVRSAGLPNRNSLLRSRPTGFAKYSFLMCTLLYNIWSAN